MVSSEVVRTLINEGWTIRIVNGEIEWWSPRSELISTVDFQLPQAVLKDAAEHGEIPQSYGITPLDLGGL